MTFAEYRQEIFRQMAQLKIATSYVDYVLLSQHHFNGFQKTLEAYSEVYKLPIDRENLMIDGLKIKLTDEANLVQIVPTTNEILPT